MQIRLKRALLVVAGSLACVGIGALVLRRVQADPSRESGSANAAPRAAIALVKREAVSNTLSIAGEFIPYQEVELHAKVSGYIRKINVDIGDRVKTGQVLAVLEVPELNAQVVGADAGVRHSKEEILRARNEVARAKASHEALHSEAMRLEQVAKQRPELIAQQEIDDAEAKDLAGEAQVEVAKSALAAAEQQLDVSKATHTQVTAMQDYSRIVAPFDGVVTWRYADTGALIQAGTSNANSAPVVKLAQVNQLRLRIPVPESMADGVHLGTVADIRVQATGDRFTAKVARFTSAFDRSTRTMQVEFDVPNENYKLSPGMYADVVIEIQKRADAVTVPVQAISYNNSKTTVLLVDANNHVQVREIRTGIEDPNRVEVLAGLNPGDRVIVGNLGAYQPGQRVDPRPSRMADAKVGEGGTE
ncbi:MAG TPA: efflux RND transporter periplasmic adaptor subunit [Terriglobales bacterium]|nr:efflux RND transporter periplasmic adaptor subunit [Terriglobales bacterium]